jgi:hypothetical protein
VDVQPRATLMKYFQCSLLHHAAGARPLHSEFYQPCSRTIRSSATIQGARGASGQTNTRAASTRKKPTSVPTARSPSLSRFHPSGWAQPMTN